MGGEGSGAVTLREGQGGGGSGVLCVFYLMSCTWVVAPSSIATENRSWKLQGTHARSGC